MVPGSTLMYGSNFWSRTRSPRCSNSMPIDAQVNPLPSELTTPPVTKMCLAITVPRGAVIGMGGRGGLSIRSVYHDGDGRVYGREVEQAVALFGRTAVVN